MITCAEMSPIKRTFIWLVGVSFLLFQFFLQLSSGIIVSVIMHERNLSALTAGLLSSAFYYVYTSFQMPVGLLFDKYNARLLLSSHAVLCAMGCFLFAMDHSLTTLFLGRLIIGWGSAFAFVGLTQVLRQNFPLKQYAFMIGLSETLGFTITVVGMIGMGSFIHSFGWQTFINGAGFLGLAIAFLCWRFIPNTKPNKSAAPVQYSKQLLLILKNKLAWVNGIFVCLEFSVITVFGALWAVPFLQVKLACSLKVASILTSMILLGAGLSCPLFGLLSMHIPKRNFLIHASCISTATLFLIALYLPTQDLLVMGFLMFSIGLCCGAYMLGYTISNELAPADLLSTCTGFTNTLAMASAPLIQPLVGFFLDSIAQRPDAYTLADYQTALLIIPAALLIASLLASFLPENRTVKLTASPAQKIVV